jgi:hypothetical protein
MKNRGLAFLIALAAFLAAWPPAEAVPGRTGLACFGETTTTCSSGVCCRTHCTTCFITYPDGTEETTYGCGPWVCTEVR